MILLVTAAYTNLKSDVPDTVNVNEEIHSWKMLVTQQINFNDVEDMHYNFE